MPLNICVHVDGSLELNAKHNQLAKVHFKGLRIISEVLQQHQSRCHVKTLSMDEAIYSTWTLNSSHVHANHDCDTISVDRNGAKPASCFRRTARDELLPTCTSTSHASISSTHPPSVAVWLRCNTFPSLPLPVMLLLPFQPHHHPSIHP